MIRRAKKEDIDAIENLLKQVLDTHEKLRPDIFISDTTKYSKEELLVMIDNDEAPIFVYEKDKVVGYAFCVINKIHSQNLVKCLELYIDDICVDKAYRNQNIGQGLIAYVENYAKEIGCDWITLNVWAGNDAAYHFYEKNGFIERKTFMEKRVKEGE